MIGRRIHFLFQNSARYRRRSAPDGSGEFGPTGGDYRRGFRPWRQYSPAILPVDEWHPNCPAGATFAVIFDAGAGPLIQRSADSRPAGHAGDPARGLLRPLVLGEADG